MIDILNGLVLADNQAIVAIDESDTGWILVRSENLRNTDVLQESSANDNGFNSGWDKGLPVGVYLVDLHPWARPDYEGVMDGGIDVRNVVALWQASPTNPTVQEVSSVSVNVESDTLIPAYDAYPANPKTRRLSKVGSALSRLGKSLGKLVEGSKYQGW
jgi:hypothetical protein